MTDLNVRTLWESMGPRARVLNPGLAPPAPVDVELNQAATTGRRARVEAVWMAQIIAHAKRIGFSCYHTHRSDRSEPGFPDLVLVRPPRLLFAELKSDSKASKPTADQIRWLDALAAAGAETYLWRPQHWPDVQRILEHGYDPHRADFDVSEPTRWRAEADR